jgi:hypothetical protein
MAMPRVIPMVMNTIRKMIFSVSRKIVNPRIMPIKLLMIGYKIVGEVFWFMAVLSTCLIDILSILKRRTQINEKTPGSSLAL